MTVDVPGILLLRGLAGNEDASFADAGQSVALHRIKFLQSLHNIAIL